MTLEKACKKLLIKEPFWGLFMIGFNKKYTTDIDTLAIRKLGIGVELLINEGFWRTLTDNEQLAVLLHELHHISLCHIFMSSDFKDHHKFNIAADAEVNCYIDNLPKGCITAEGLGLPNCKGAKWYYENIPDPSSGETPSVGMGLPEPLDDHSFWKEMSELPEASKQLVSNTIDTMLKTVAEQVMKRNGTIPGCLSERVEKLLKDRPPVYDWKKHLRRLLGSRITTELKRTVRRESKRLTGAPGIKFRKSVDLLVAVDTSGSISSRQLTEFFAEINHIHRAGAHVVVLEFDSKMQKIWDFSPEKKIVVKGRGGTDFKPAADYYNEHRHAFGMMVWLTDGYASIPDNMYHANDMLWVLTDDGYEQYYPGKVLHMPNEQNY